MGTSATRYGYTDHRKPLQRKENKADRPTLWRVHIFKAFFVILRWPSSLPLLLIILQITICYYKVDHSKCRPIILQIYYFYTYFSSIT
jgi:hypothetical protein